MNRILKVAFLLGLSYVSLTAARAQNCSGMYYSDTFLDGNGNFVALNYSDAAGSCGSYSSYADVTATMPDGSTHFGSASGVDSYAEALVSTPAPSAGQQGTISGSNELDALSCFSSFFDRFFLTAYTRSHWKGTQTCEPGVPDPSIVFCENDVEDWCTVETTPPNLSISQIREGYRAGNTRPLPYWEVLGLCIRVLQTDPWTCPGFPPNRALNTTGPGGVLPRAACTKQ